MLKKLSTQKSHISKSSRKKDSELQTTLQIGKNGITDNLVKELKNQLKTKKKIKLKLLKNFIGEKDKKELIKEIEELSGGNCTFFRGFSMILEKK